MNKLILYSVLLVLTNTVSAQLQTLIGPEIKQEKRAIEHFQLGKHGDCFYTISRTTAGKGLTFYLEKYKESTLELVERFPFQLPTEDMVGIRWAKMIDGKILLLFQDVDKSAKMTMKGLSFGMNWKFYIAGQYLSLDGKLLGEPLQFSEAGARVEISPNSKYLLFSASEWDETKPANASGYHTPEKVILSLYKTQNLQPVVAREIDLFNEKSGSVMKTSNTFLDNSGVMYYIARTYKADNPLDCFYTANKFDIIGNVSSEVKINTKRLQFFSLTTAPIDNKIKLIGYYYNYNNNLKADVGKDEYYPVDEEIKGLYSADVDFATSSLLNETYAQETVNGKEKYSKTSKGAKKVNLYLWSTEHIYFNSDKSYYLVSQVSSFDRGYTGNQYHKDIFYWGFDILVTKFSSGGKVEWTKQIPFFNGYSQRYETPHEYHALHVNDKIYILRREHANNWTKYYEKKSISSHEFKDPYPFHECVFLIDEVDKSGNVRTEKVNHNKKKFVKWDNPSVFLNGILYETKHRYLAQYDGNIILCTEHEDKDKLEFIKISLK